MPAKQRHNDLVFVFFLIFPSHTFGTGSPRWRCHDRTTFTLMCPERVIRAVESRDGGKFIIDSKLDSLKFDCANIWQLSELAVKAGTYLLRRVKSVWYMF